MEFTVVFFVATLFLIVILGIFSEEYSQQSQQIRMENEEELLSYVAKELRVASVVNDGYSRELYLEKDVNLSSVVVPYYHGTFTKGFNTIIKNETGIYVT